MTANTDALLAQSRLYGALGGIKSAVSAAAFLGVEDQGERIVIVVNTSASVSVMRKARNRGYTIERIQAEVLRLIDGLESGTRFVLVQFSQGVRQFASFVAPATASNRASGIGMDPIQPDGQPPGQAGTDLLWA